MLLLIVAGLCVLSKVSCQSSSDVWYKEKYDSYEYSILVDEKYRNSSSCPSQSNISCATTFNKALLNVKYSSTIIHISPGNYTLDYGQNITYKHHIAIVGSGDLETIINCNHTASAGLMISSSEDVTISSITFNNCSYETYTEKLTSEFRETHLLPSTLYFHLCDSVSITDVIIYNGNGIGVCLSQTTGNIVIENCIIHGKQLKAEKSYNSVIGGGIVAANSEYTEGLGQLLILNCTIKNNHYRANEKLEVGCVVNHVTGGVVLVNPPYHIAIDSSLITDNDFGVFIVNSIYNEGIFLDIKNTQVMNNTSDIELYLETGKSNVTLYESDVSKALTITTAYTFYVTTLRNQLQTSELISDYLTIRSTRRDIIIDFIQDYHLFNCFDDHYAMPFIGKCSANKSFEGQCPITYSICFFDYSTENIVNNCSCYDNHAGTLCGQCKEGYGVAINSPYLACVPCNDSLTVFKGWILLIVLEFIPLTVMIALIAILNVNLNQGSLKAYIFLCQMVTISLTFPSLGFPTWATFNNRAYSTLLLPFSIWNLIFINYPSCNRYGGYFDEECSSLSICISPNTSPLLAISFWYVIAFYPLILLAVVYGFITLYDKGYRCIIVVIRPFHRLLARLWRILDIQPSLTHTVASVYTLCFTQLAATSVKILQGIRHDSGLVFFYDGSQKYFQGWHGAAGTLAIILLLVFNIIPTICLSLYAFDWFERSFKILKLKKDFIISVMKVFIDPYKHGDKSQWSYQYLAGLYFSLQLVMMALAYISNIYDWNAYFVTDILFGCICCLLFFFDMMVRPYKRNIHTFSEAFVFLSLGVLSGTGVIFIAELENYPLEVFMLFIIPASICYFFCIFACFQCLVWSMKKCSIIFHCAAFLRPNAYAKEQNERIQRTEQDENINETTFGDRNRLLNSEVQDHTFIYNTINDQ